MNRILIQNSFSNHLIISQIMAHSSFMNYFSFAQRIDVPKIHHYKMINQYLCLLPLGKGSSSKVYLAKDCHTSQDVAIKMIHFQAKPKSSFINQVIREIRIFQKMDHPNIIKLKEILFSEEKRTIYLVMEFASYGSLDLILKMNRKISESLAATIFKQVIQATADLHQKRFIHHDIKPMNILLTKNGKAKLSDFGISTSFESVFDLYGSPAYQAPEIFDDDYDILSQFNASQIDVWSLGVSLFESVFGILPFEGDDAFQIFSSIQNNPVSIPDRCSAELRDLIQKMLTVNPQKRISINELLDHPFFHLYHETDFDSFEPIFIPEINLTQDIIHHSVPIWKNDNLEKLTSFLPFTRPINSISSNFCVDGFIIENFKVL
jgi:serine/threonine-protein kinase 11